MKGPTQRRRARDERRPEPDPLLRRAILDCRDKLPPKPRQAFDSRLTSAGGHDDVELAESLGMKVNTFLQNFTRARQLLVDCLKKKGIALWRPRSTKMVRRRLHERCCKRL